VRDLTKDGDNIHIFKSCDLILDDEKGEACLVMENYQYNLSQFDKKVKEQDKVETIYKILLDILNG
jgi:hypothetical protein